LNHFVNCVLSSRHCGTLGWLLNLRPGREARGVREGGRGGWRGREEFREGESEIESASDSEKRGRREEHLSLPPPAPSNLLQGLRREAQAQLHTRTGTGIPTGPSFSRPPSLSIGGESAAPQARGAGVRPQRRREPGRYKALHHQQT
jgi:hypothetical protein